MPGYLADLAVHRPTRTGVVTFANAYGFRAGSIGAITRQLLTEVLDAEPAPVRPWRPAAGPPEPAVAELTGRWWWMGREYEVTWDGDAERAGVHPAPPGRGTAVAVQPRSTPTTGAAASGTNDGEILAGTPDAGRRGPGARHRHLRLHPRPGPARPGPLSHRVQPRSAAGQLGTVTKSISRSTALISGVSTSW